MKLEKNNTFNKTLTIVYRGADLEIITSQLPRLIMNNQNVAFVETESFDSNLFHNDIIKGSEKVLLLTDRKIQLIDQKKNTCVNIDPAQFTQESISIMKVNAVH